MTLHRIWLCLGLAIAASGCTTVNLSQITSSYDALIEKRNAGITDGLAVPSSPVSEDGGIQQQEGQAALRERFGVLAQDAFKLGQEASEPATRIAAYRVAGLAAWQHSPTSPMIDQAQTAGLAVCNGLSEDDISAPRDCAILRYLKILVAYEELTLAMNRLPEPAAGDLRALPAPDLLIQAGGLGATEEGAWTDITSSARAYAGMNEATRGYFQAVTFVSACLVSIAHRNSQVVFVGQTIPEDFAGSVKTAEERFLPVLKATQLLKDADATSWLGSRDINCSKYMTDNKAPSLLTQQ